MYLTRTHCLVTIQRERCCGGIKWSPKWEGRGGALKTYQEVRKTFQENVKTEMRHKGPAHQKIKFHIESIYNLRCQRQCDLWGNWNFSLKKRPEEATIATENRSCRAKRKLVTSLVKPRKQNFQVVVGENNHHRPADTEESPKGSGIGGTRTSGSKDGAECWRMGYKHI